MNEPRARRAPAKRAPGRTAAPGVPSGKRNPSRPAPARSAHSRPVPNRPAQRRPMQERPAPARPVSERRPMHPRERVPKEHFTMFVHDPGPVSGGFVATLAVLLVFGLIMLFSASYATAFYKYRDSYRFIRPQVLFALIGTAAMWAVSRMDYHWLRQFSRPMYVGVLILLVVVLFMDPIQGCRRWINLPHVPTIQVSEIAKFSVILLMSDLFTKNKERVRNFKEGVLLPAILLLPILALLFLEPHHSAMVLMCCITASIMFAGGCRLFYFVAGALSAAGAMAAMLYLRPGYVQERLYGWFHPFSDMMDSTRQTGQSLYTIGAGGLFGVGIGNSVQKHAWLPEAPNDFIFAILCEELGFVGAVLCIFLFVLLIVQGILIAVRAPDRFGFLLVIGTVAQVGFQFVFNVAVVTNLIPNTGISLPFFSSGGTSLLMLLGQIGVVLSVSRAGNKRQAELKEEEAQAKEEKQREAAADTTASIWAPY